MRPTNNNKENSCLLPSWELTTQLDYSIEFSAMIVNAKPTSRKSTGDASNIYPKTTGKQLK